MKNQSLFDGICPMAADVARYLEECDQIKNLKPM